LDIISAIPSIGNSVWTLLFFVVALSVIVAVHEYGHYIVGRWSGIKAEVFSLGFGPVLLSRHDRRGTKWQIAAIPFGGYVKFLGDANAASGKDGEAMQTLSREEMRQTIHGAPLWARAATVAAGPVFNFVFSAIVFAGLILVQGQAREPLTIGELRALPYAQNELLSGDELIEVGGMAVPGLDADRAAYDAFRAGLPKEPVLSYLVRRDGQETTVPGPYYFPPLVTAVTPLSAAADAGLEKGDVITGVAGQPVFDFDQLKTVVEGSGGAAVALKVWRAGEMHDFVLVPRQVDEPQPEGGFKTELRIGIAGGTFYEPATERYGVFEAAWLGVKSVWAVIELAMSGLWNLITGAISSCNMAGPLGMASLSGHMASQGVSEFVQFVALISTAIGLFNLFPVPVLDGGHLVFYAYEAVMGRPASDRVYGILMTFGLIVILTLMVFAFGNDIVCWFIRKGLF
jgi:regulator of sigma E protease